MRTFPGLVSRAALKPAVKYVVADTGVNIQSSRVTDPPGRTGTGLARVQIVEPIDLLS
ncbi:hypothetical protein CUJ84_Chr002904 [Rhizobium leguminosarum]|uniref:Uncharacterized protein n=1 Tax=Rhizobium leguminosarum TaxID=384 RepID=A0A2K9Z4T6_RHILE|nr:hypothetical protein CUJ84_Chr002904 [Rhizobium leguminosarum]